MMRPLHASANSKPAMHITGCKTRRSNSESFPITDACTWTVQILSHRTAVGLLEMRCHWKHICERETTQRGPSVCVVQKTKKKEGSRLPDVEDLAGATLKC